MALDFDYRFPAMSASEILAELHRLTPANREKVRSHLDAIDSAAPPSSVEKQLIDQRVATYRTSPGAAVSWAFAEKEIRRQIGL